MLNNFKYFKYTRRIGFNVINSPKVAYTVILLFRIKKWNLFSKPLKTQTNLFWISKFFFTNQINKVTDYVSFFKRKQRSVSTSSTYKTLDFCLYSAKFFKTIRQSRFFINRGFVKVNSFIISKPDYRLKPGDVVSLKWDVTSHLAHVWVCSFFFQVLKK